MANHVKENELHRVVVTAIIYNDEGKFLVTKRTDDQKVYPGQWTVPGGGLEADDYVNEDKTTTDAWYFIIEKVLKREVLEEVNVEITKLKYLLDLIFVRPDGIPVIVLSYYAKYDGGEVALDPTELSEYKWVTADEAMQLDMIEGIAEEIEMTDKILKGEKDVEFRIRK